MAVSTNYPTVLKVTGKVVPGLARLSDWLKKRHFQKIPLHELKERTHILFIDDQDFDVIERLTDDGWNVDKIEDITNLSDCKVSRAHVIFVDFKGVGHQLAPQEEGVGLIRVLKSTYSKKRVILYSAHSEFSLADELDHEIADDILPKNSEPYVYIEKIERNARIALGL